MFRVDWSDGLGDGSTAAVDGAGEKVAAARFEALQETAADLVSGQSLDAVLARITERAALAVRAPRFLLVVRPIDGDEPAVHFQGYSEADARGLAPLLLEGASVAPDGPWLVAEVASTRRHYGRLAASLPSGTRFLPGEDRLLTAYGRLAAAALDSATAVETARREARTAQALLGLARNLASVGTSEEIAQRLATCVPDVVDCDAAAVWLWDEDASSLRARGTHGLAPDVAEWARSLAVGTSDTPRLAALVAEPHPVFLGSGTGDPFLAEVLAGLGFESLAIVPILVEQKLAGLITAGVTDDARRLRRDEHILERLAGLADHGAIALQNASLLDRTTYLALHDPVTGLANLRLLRDRAENAAARLRRTGERFALLFVDVDGFKLVNDQFGHAAGDDLLCQVAGLLQDTVRELDTVARIGGDEFLVLLPAVADDAAAVAVAVKVAAAIGTALTVGGHIVSVSASIGLSVAGRDGETFDDLVQAADAAMYSAKRLGGGTWALTQQPRMPT